jgi:glycosyltransferase involved in cell wall biosynthesis
MLGNIISALGPRFEADVLTIREQDMGYVQKIRKQRLLRVPVGGTYIERVESFQRALSRQLDGDEYDIIHFRSPWEGATIATKREYFDAKYVYEPAHVLPFNTSSAIKTKYMELEKESLELADLVIVSSKWAAKQLELSGYNKPIQVVYPFVNTNLFDWDVTIGLSPMDIVWTDNFDNIKSILFVLNSFAKIKLHKPAFTAGIIGPIDDSIADKITDFMEKNGLSENIKFFGAIDEESLPLIISRGTVGIVPPPTHITSLFRREDSINSVEYMACKVPLVAPDTPFINEITMDGEMAYLYDPNSSNSLAAQILTAIDKSEKFDDKTEIAYNNSREKFSASSMRRKIVKAYARLLPPLQQSEDGVFDSNGIYKSSTISWQGQQTSSTGVGSNRPTGPLFTQDTEEKVQSEITLQIDEIEFEASGTLLGASYDDHNPDLHDETTDPIIPVD